MLFLGAGASNAVEIGHLSILTQKIYEKLKKTQHRRIYDNIVKKLNQKNKSNRYYENDEIDIEVILSVLNKCISPDLSLREMGPFAVFRSNSKERTYSLNELSLKEMYSVIDEVITQHCLQYNEKKALEYYGSLISLDNSILKFKTYGGESYTKILDKIVTLNYDLVIERTFPKLDRSVRRGLRTEPLAGDHYVALDEIFRNELHPNERINYLKLHGSIDWRFRDDDGLIVQRDTGFAMSGRNATQQNMIYPIFDKNISDQFYFTFYLEFKRILLQSEIYLIIGYSFRDPSVNDSLKFALSKIADSRMIVVSTNQNVIKRVRSIYGSLEGKVDILQCRFGDPDLIDKLRSLLE